MRIATPAATLILYRAGGRAPGAVLMVERARGMAFAGGALVFPGGKVDPGDHDMAAAALPGMAADVAAAHVAAVRETIEEVGIAVGLTPPPDAAAIARIRAGLAAGRGFAVLLRAEGLRLVPEALTPFARWRPDLPGARLFDTIFFVAEAPEAAASSPDGTECVRAFWERPGVLLDAADAGRHKLVYPTRRNLERLASLETAAAARDHAIAFPVRAITPFIAWRDGEEWLCIPEDRGYPIVGEPMSRVMRT